MIIQKMENTVSCLEICYNAFENMLLHMNFDNIDAFSL